MLRIIPAVPRRPPCPCPMRPPSRFHPGPYVSAPEGPRAASASDLSGPNGVSLADTGPRGRSRQHSTQKTSRCLCLGSEPHKTMAEGSQPIAVSLAAFSLERGRLELPWVPSVLQQRGPEHRVTATSRGFEARVAGRRERAGHSGTGRIFPAPLERRGSPVVASTLQTSKSKP